MKIGRLFAILLLPLFLFCCYNEEEKCYEVPLLCDQTTPSTGAVTVRITSGSSRTVVFYKGKIEENREILRCSQTDATAEYEMSYGYITAAIDYTIMINDTPFTVRAVDGDEMKYTSDVYCDGVICYKPGKITLDLQIDTAAFIRDRANAGK